jgi:hypothetical protein
VDECVCRKCPELIKTGAQPANGAKKADDISNCSGCFSFSAPELSRGGQFDGAASPERVREVRAFKPPEDPTRLAGVLVQNGQHLVGPPVAQPVVDEVDRPDVVGIQRPQANDRCVVMIEPLAAFVPLRQLQAFLAPDPLAFL